MQQQSISSKPRQILSRIGRKPSPIDNRKMVRTAVLITIVFLGLAYLSTLQTHINGSENPYATDVGEIQNALPRWGTIHLPGYPQYSFLGSLFVTVLRPIMEPAVSTSLYSALWGLVAAALMVLVFVELGVPPWIAAGTTSLFGLNLSMWVDSSVAEIHTMTMALLLALLLVGLRFYKQGDDRNLYWLAFLSGTAVTHQRGAIFIVLALLPLVWPHRRLIFGRLPRLIVLFLLGPMTYLYLSLVAWLGVEWTFGSPGTWEGLQALFIDTIHVDILVVPETADTWLDRFRVLGGLLLEDWPIYLLLPGLVGLVLPGPQRLVRIGLLGGLVGFLVASLIIWEGFVSDALLAIKMPVILFAALGLGWLLNWLVERYRILGITLPILFLVGMVALIFVNRSAVLEITRDDSRLEFIEQMKRLEPAADGRPQTMTVLWGHDYWALTYAQAYRDAFPDVQFVTHDRNFINILERGDHFLTPTKTFFYRPINEWERLIGGSVYLSMKTPDIVELKNTPDLTTVKEPLFDFGNGIVLETAELTQISPTELQLHLVWVAQQDNLPDYSVAVHLISQDPPAGPDDILAQADRGHPVDGWYPTSQWQMGERVEDYYRLNGDVDTAESVRLSFYKVVDGAFQNTPWLSLSVE